VYRTPASFFKEVPGMGACRAPSLPETSRLSSNEIVDRNLLRAIRDSNSGPSAPESANATRPELTAAYNPLTSPRSSAREDVRNSRPFTPFTKAFGPTLVQAAARGSLSALKAAPAQLLTVREAAARLRVSPVTIYRLCAQGKLPHLRVSNALRISSEDVDALVGSRS
jgi:excisionase family DNA binding protein